MTCLRSYSVISGLLLSALAVTGCSDDDSGTSGGANGATNGADGGANGATNGANGGGANGAVDGGGNGATNGANGGGANGAVDGGGNGATNGGGDGGGSVDCSAYCTTIMTTCSGMNEQYASEDECMMACAGFDTSGTAGDASGDTLQCRMTHLGLAASMGPEVHCPHAGEDGGGVCVD